MSTRYFGVGKSYRTAQEAFKDASWYEAIERPKSNEHGLFYGVLIALFLSSFFAWAIFTAITRF